MNSSQPVSTKREPERRWFEPVAAILMALSTLSTAWCSYQSSKWSAQSNNYSTQADKLSRQAIALYLEGNQVLGVQIDLVTQTVNAHLAGNEKIAQFYSQRFPPDLRKAYDAWLLQKPYDNPHADPNPFVPHLYTPRYSAERKQALEDAKRIAAEAGKTGQIASKYLSNTVLLAMVLFFAGTTGKFEQRYIRHATLFFAIAIFIYTAVRMLELPAIGGIVNQ